MNRLRRLSNRITGYAFQAKTMRYAKAPEQSAHNHSPASSWGTLTRYIEYADDLFALRQVDEYENGHLTRYDRDHWEDQYGTLADFRFGKKFIEHWGEPQYITKEEFEAKWRAAEQSPPRQPRNSPPNGPPPWIRLFESGKWKGQP